MQRPCLARCSIAMLIAPFIDKDRLHAQRERPANAQSEIHYSHGQLRFPPIKSMSWSSMARNTGKRDYPLGSLLRSPANNQTPLVSSPS